MSPDLIRIAQLYDQWRLAAVSLDQYPTQVEIVDGMFQTELQNGNIKLTQYMKYAHDIRKNVENETFSAEQIKQIIEILAPAPAENKEGT